MYCWCLSPAGTAAQAKPADSNRGADFPSCCEGSFPETLREGLTEGLTRVVVIANYYTGCRRRGGGPSWRAAPVWHWVLLMNLEQSLPTVPVQTCQLSDDMPTILYSDRAGPAVSVQHLQYTFFDNLPRT